MVLHNTVTVFLATQAYCQHRSHALQHMLNMSVTSATRTWAACKTNTSSSPHLHSHGAAVHRHLPNPLQAVRCQNNQGARLLLGLCRGAGENILLIGAVAALQGVGGLHKQMVMRQGGRPPQLLVEPRPGVVMSAIQDPCWITPQERRVMRWFAQSTSNSASPPAWRRSCWAAHPPGALAS
jgi:hypothetical protein